MNILVINCGSSSIKAAIIENESGVIRHKLHIQRIGASGASCTIDADEHALPAEAKDHQGAFAFAMPLLQQKIGALVIDGVAHRVVHGGDKFQYPTRIDAEVEGVIEKLSPLAPLHNPANLAGIRAARALLPNLEHIAVFDTAFHATLPRRAYHYALPTALSQKHSLRRYGFHGQSHQYVAKLASDYLRTDLRDLRVISCHLGNGASVAAIEYGRSVETSMGMTPLEGLVMGTRSGDLDPGVVLYLLREGYTTDDIDRILNRESGLAGLSGVGNDLRDIEARAASGDEACRLAIQVFAHRVRKYIGAYAAIMGGVDAIIFTAGIGQNSALMRHRIAQRLDFLGANLDEDRNRDVKLTPQNPVFEISPLRSRCRLLAIATNEEHAIAQEAAQLVQKKDAVSQEKKIPVAISARHIHLTQQSVDVLFGPGYQLTRRNDLSQPGQFACNETLTVVGPKNSIERVRILGPLRPQDQVEVSRTDEFFLGLDAPIRASGDVKNTPGITLVGPKGKVDLKQGVICAWRHIHMTPADAEHFGVQDRDIVEVAIAGTGRDLIFGDVLVRVHSSFALEMHLDTDEANAAELNQGSEGALVSTEGVATLRTRRTRFDKNAD
jgi:acetate kinase